MKQIARKAEKRKQNKNPMKKRIPAFRIAHFLKKKRNEKKKKKISIALSFFFVFSKIPEANIFWP